MSPHRGSRALARFPGARAPWLNHVAPTGAAVPPTPFAKGSQRATQFSVSKGCRTLRQEAVDDVGLHHLARLVEMVVDECRRVEADAGVDRGHELNRVNPVLARGRAGP